MPRKRKKNDMRAGELNLTAMIDMAFQLLSFFVITVAPVEVVTHLKANSVSADTRGPPKEMSSSILRIKVLSDGNYAWNGRGINKDSLATMLNESAHLDNKQTVLVLCTLQSSHRNLIEVLDLCKKAGFTDLSLGSAE